MRGCRKGRHEYRTAAAAVCQCGRGADKRESTQQPITVGSVKYWLRLEQCRDRVCQPLHLQNFQHRSRCPATLRNVLPHCELAMPVWIYNIRNAARSIHTWSFTPVWVTVWVTPPHPRKSILKKFGKQGKTADFLRNQRRFGCGGRI